MHTHIVPSKSHYLSFIVQQIGIAADPQVELKVQAGDSSKYKHSPMIITAIESFGFLALQRQNIK